MCWVGESKPASWCACEIAAARRVRVLAFRVSAAAVKYSATVSGDAGRACRPCPAHQAVKSRQAFSNPRMSLKG